LTHDIGGTGGVRCVNEMLKNCKPFVNWRKPLMTYAETCRGLKNTDEIKGGVSDTPLSPSLYSDPRTDP